MKATFIVNKTAGRGKAGRLWPEIKKEVATFDWELTEIFTNGPREATRLAKEQVLQGAELIVAVGGDGTLSEVVNGIVLAGKCSVGLIPVGTGNDFAKTVNIPLAWMEACRILKANYSKSVDLGLVNGRYFINIAGIGFDAEVANEINTSFKHFTGLTGYLLAVFKRFLFFKIAKVDIKIDNLSLQKEIILLAIGNATCYGGGIFITPEAKIDDGLFDLCVIEKTTRLDFLVSLPLVLKGKHLKHPKVSIFRGQKIRVESSQKLNVHADGEIIGTTPVSCEIIKQAIQFITPKENQNQEIGGNLN